MKPKKPYWEMNLEELREATREYDKETLGLPGKPLTAADRKLFARARRRARQRADSDKHLPGKPLTPAMRKKLAEARRRARQIVNVELEPALLKKVDAAAHKLKMTRAQLIVEGLHKFLKRAG